MKISNIVIALSFSIIKVYTQTTDSKCDIVKNEYCQKFAEEVNNQGYCFCGNYGGVSECYMNDIEKGYKFECNDNTEYPSCQNFCKNGGSICYTTAKADDNRDNYFDPSVETCNMK